MRYGFLVPVGLLAAGAAVVVIAVLRGEATAGLLVVFPFVVGQSALLLLGVGLLIAGFLTLPLAFALERTGPLPPAEPATTGERRGTSGGLVLIGPIPIFFGSWKNVSRRTRIAAAAVGAAVLIVLAVGLALVFR